MTIQNVIKYSPLFLSHADSPSLYKWFFGSLFTWFWQGSRMPFPSSRERKTVFPKPRTHNTVNCSLILSSLLSTFGLRRNGISISSMSSLPPLPKPYWIVFRTPWWLSLEYGDTWHLFFFLAMWL